MSDHRFEKDSMAEMQVPVDSFYGAQTQCAGVLPEDELTKAADAYGMTG